MEKIEEAVNPEGVLREIINSSVQKLVSYAQERGIDAKRMIVRLSSVNLESCLNVHIQKVNTDAAESILHRLMILDQSNKAKGRATLTGKEFQIDATTFPSASKKRRQTKTKNPVNSSNSKRRRRVGAGRNRRRFRPVRIPINRQGLHEINNAGTDSFCLFRAIELLRVKARTYKQDFFRYLRDKRRQTEDVNKIMRELRVDTSLEGYDIETYGPMIQNRYNRLYPGQFKIFAFDEEDPMKPYYSTNVVDYKTPICVLFSEDHFDAIKSISQLLQVRAYCLTCETPYHRNLDHNMKCLARCKNCGRIDPSGPCPSDGTPRNECGGCNKFFINT